MLCKDVGTLVWRTFGENGEAGRRLAQGRRPSAARNCRPPVIAIIRILGGMAKAGGGCDSRQVSHVAEAIPRPGRAVTSRLTTVSTA